eukprot:CAMPEP_0116128614 /NCGR_PEP_ID=MMETSP0329-20121206/7452_1 /TAXON_ID=697910 /ORGANISM="Pseudo-nitzschia arenysensis, Strain B593" /LENGTH=58 /DNA_ID=CAMNT_0003622761 /DNA_START=261 /DNA_END=437 /DNA_ORIENTATION=-
MVLVVAAKMDEGPKTAAAHPTKQPLYPRRPFLIESWSRPNPLAVAVAVIVPRAANPKR